MFVTLTAFCNEIIHITNYKEFMNSSCKIFLIFHIRV
ncbi:hypothetical protein [Anaerovorax odorimutans]